VNDYTRWENPSIKPDTDSCLFTPSFDIAQSASATPTTNGWFDDDATEKHATDDAATTSNDEKCVQHNNKGQTWLHKKLD
jgi:hypothetical protein